MEVFQSNANRPLSDSLGYIVNLFEHVWRGMEMGSLFGEVQAEQV